VVCWRWGVVRRGWPCAHPTRRKRGRSRVALPRPTDAVERLSPRVAAEAAPTCAPPAGAASAATSRARAPGTHARFVRAPPHCAPWRPNPAALAACCSCCWSRSPPGRCGRARCACPSAGIRGRRCASTRRRTCSRASSSIAPPATATPLADRVTGDGCGFDNAFRIARTSVAVGEPFALSCRSALALAMWERHALQQAATTHLGSPVARIEHFGSYSCRNLYGREGGRRSRHATADAFDIAGFVLEDGRRVRVLGDWAAGDDASTPEAAFL